MSKRQKIIISITGITLILLILVGLTYAYFLTRIQGNTNTKSVSVTTANLALVYGDGNGYIHAELIQPGTTLGTKTFTVTNEGNVSVEYGVFLEDVINDFVRTQDLQLTITCSSSISGNTCNGYTGDMPYQNDYILSNSIEEDEVQSYTLTLEYIEAGIDQSVDMNKIVEGKVQIYDLNNTVDLEGIITGYNSGDYIVVNSEPKESQIRSDGTYKVVGLEPGSHKISVYNSSDIKQYEKSLTIQLDEEENISGSSVTVTNETRKIMAGLSSSGVSITNMSDNSYKKGTLAYAILNNAENVTNEQKALLYAEYSPTPKSQPARADSGANESTLSKTLDDYGTSYYFRGNVTNNYVNFAGMCWRVVRIEGDGSVKLILDDATYECDNANYTHNWNVIDGDPYGYGSNAVWGIDIDPEFYNYASTLNTKIGTKYTGKGLNDYLKRDEWCYDSSVAYTDSTPYEIEYDYDTYYAPYDRIQNKKEPSLKCPARNRSQQYVSGLTVDEIAFAGTGSKGYLYSTLPNSIGQLGDEIWINACWWTISFAFEILQSNELSMYIYFTSIQTIHDHDEYETIRPAITLKSNMDISSGIGTQSNPYVIN